MTDKEMAGTHEFKAEVKQLLDILVHSLYTNREVFLRELVSNASDALDKLRFETNRGTEIAHGDLELEIRIAVDKDRNVLTITDTGIGMTGDEVIENIGTIAKSGSAEFLRQAKEDSGPIDNIIGKFGVGFYSVFMAAREVVIRSRSYLKEESPVEWRSDGLGTYEITPIHSDFKRGTTIDIYLKEDAKEFADTAHIKEILKRHSSFISFPIFVDGERVNTVSAIWREPKFSLTQEQYDEFYKFLTFDTEAPLETLHISVDAPVQFNSLLFIPRTNRDLFTSLSREYHGLDLYAHRVLIQKGNKDLIPEYLGFVRGVVDSEDLPLNISRETLQENLVLNRISTVITRQILTQMQKVAKEDPAKYEQLWNSHCRAFKFGYTDFANRDRYAELLRFNSSRCQDARGLISFDEYIHRAKPGQNEIYYMFGPSREAIFMSPHMEIFKAKGIEVLFLMDHLDEFAMGALGKYKDFELRSVEHMDAKALEQYESVEAEEKPDVLSETDEEEFQSLLKKIKEILGDRITEVRVSSRLSESPCCLVNPDGGMTSSMQKILQIVSKDTSIPQKVFEVNKDHRLVRNLLTIFKANTSDDYLRTVVEQLFESALLLDGYLKDPHAMVNRIQDLLNKSSNWYLAVTQPHP